MITQKRSEYTCFRRVCVYQILQFMYCVKPRLHRNPNRIRMRTWHAKMMRMFDVDVFLRRGKQHSAVWRTFGEQPNAIRSVNSRMLSVDCWYIKGNSRTTIHLCRVNSLPRRTPNNLQIYLHEHTHRFCMAHSCSRTDVNSPLSMGVRR